MKRCAFGGVALALFVGAVASQPTPGVAAFQAVPAAQTPAAAADRWEADMKKFEALDKVAPPPKNGVVFIGDGKTRPELYVADGLHMSADGYRIWNGLLGPLVAN